MLPHIFETDLRVNTEIYLQVMETVVLPWIKPWVWQKDSAPCHISKHSLTWLKEYCYNLITKDEWPLCNPDLNPIDYFFWGVLETLTNQHLISPRNPSLPSSRSTAPLWTEKSGRKPTGTLGPGSRALSRLIAAILSKMCF